MTVREALSKGIEILKSANIEAPAGEAGVMLCFTINCDRAFIYSHSEYVLNDKELKSYLTHINSRAGGMPLQYITGNQEFMSLDFSVGPGVFIPRHDTEALVETVINSINSMRNNIYAPNSQNAETQNESIDILDIGTGSGCVAVSLAYYMKSCRVTAVDISEKALETAYLNAVKAGVEERVAFIQSNLFGSLKKSDFDMIVSNPPYIPDDCLEDLQAEVKNYEPLSALNGGPDGLDFYRAIIRDSVNFLKPDGLLAFEVGCDQAKAVYELMNGRYYNIDVIKDLAQIERVVTGRLKP